MFVSDTLTLITAELLKKNNWHPLDGHRNEKNQPYAFVANYDGKVAKLVNNLAWKEDFKFSLTDEWTFTLEDIVLAKTAIPTSLIAKVSTVKYMEELAFLLDLCHISWVKIRI